MGSDIRLLPQPCFAREAKGGDPRGASRLVSLWGPLYLKQTLPRPRKQLPVCYVCQLPNSPFALCLFWEIREMSTDTQRAPEGVLSIAKLNHNESQTEASFYFWAPCQARTNTTGRKQARLEVPSATSFKLFLCSRDRGSVPTKALFDLKLLTDLRSHTAHLLAIDYNRIFHDKVRGILSKGETSHSTA